MTLWNVGGQYFDDSAYENMRTPEGALRVPEYRNVAQFGGETFQWDPQGQAWYGRNIAQTSPGYLTGLLDLRQRVRSGQAQPWEVEQYQDWEAQAQAIPTRDIGSLTAAWQGGTSAEKHQAWQSEGPEWWGRLDPGSPDVGPIMLQIADRMERGQASPQERQLYSQVHDMATDWAWRASVPQASDAFSLLGDNLLSALGMLGIGASGGLAAAPLAAGGASLATTLGSIGTLTGIAGTGAGVLGQALDQPWLSRLGLGLGAVGGLTGAATSLVNLANTGVRSLSDAARLASVASRVTGTAGTLSGNDALRQASQYLGLVGNVGRVGAGVLPTSFTDWSGDNAPLAANIAPPIGVQNLLSAADVATQRGGGEGMEWDYSWDYGGGDQASMPYDNWSWDYGGDTRVPESFLSWADPYGPGSSGDTTFAGEGSGGFLSTLASLGRGALGLLGGGSGGGAGGLSSWLGPLLSGAGGIASGAIGANASSDAARLQAAALNRGLDLQTAQWLQQQANQAPWLQAGQQALAHMAGRSTWDQPALSQVAPLSGAGYPLPSAMPGWTPQTYAGYTPTDTPSAAGYRYTPGQGPRAADYRYTPGEIPAASQYRYTPGAVPTLQGAELLANDPGYQFRQDEARRALEASALARGAGMSGATLSALQRQAQDLASQEYGQAWNRAAQQAQMREGWAQQASQLGFGQAMSEAQLREQVNQLASQQGWSQAQAETVLREQLAQQAGAQNWQQALQEAQQRAQQAQFGWQSGLTAQQAGQRERQQFETDLYSRLMQQNQLQYGRDWAQREAENARLMEAYNAQRLGQNTAFNQFSTLAGLGQTSAGQLGQVGQANATQQASLLGQLGSAQGMGQLGSALNWQQAISGGVGGLQNLLRGLNA